jgi:hypothetical protein
MNDLNQQKGNLKNNEYKIILWTARNNNYNAIVTTYQKIKQLEKKFNLIYLFYLKVNNQTHHDDTYYHSFSLLFDTHLTSKWVFIFPRCVRDIRCILKGDEYIE